MEQKEEKEEGEEETKAAQRDVINCSVKSVWPLKSKSTPIQRKENLCFTSPYRLILLLLVPPQSMFLQQVMSISCQSQNKYSFLGFSMDLPLHPMMSSPI